ncbi:mucin-13-like [Acanthopagrus schlegelii]
MENPRSSSFREAAQKITKSLDEVFKDTKDYSESTVLKLERGSTTRVWSREEKLPVKATVEIIFLANADVTTGGIVDKIDSYVKECDNCLLTGATFKNESLCKRQPCDDKTTECNPLDGRFHCTCMESYILTNFSDRMCTACPSGQKAVSETNECVNCPFGRSGLNCKESWQLALVIVGSVFGALLLISTSLLPLVAHQFRKKGSKKNEKTPIAGPYVNNFPTKTPVNNNFASSKADSVNEVASALAKGLVPRIPRATTKSDWDSRYNLEMTPSNSWRDLVPGGRNPRLYFDDHDMDPYTQSRPESTLFSWPRPQVNTNASSKGWINPHYVDDDEGCYT